MKTYTDHDGYTWHINDGITKLSQDLYADLVEAVTLAQTLQGKLRLADGKYERAIKALDRCADESGQWRAYAVAFEAYFDGHTAVRPTREAYGL